MSMFQTADEVVIQIEQRKNRGYGLEHFKDYMKSIGDPQTKLRCIHVAGTNGKGSTTNDIRSILQEAGYRVASFTSPYMISHYDRIRVNNEDIPKEAFLSIANRYYDSWMKWDLSMFEIDMCIAVLYFQQQNVDFCVFEVGLGGRLDSTNIITPMVSVITNIGLDHMELLGDTLEEIAKEKAGIVKPGVDLVTGEKESSCLAVFASQVQHANSKLIMVHDVSQMEENEVGIVFDYGTYQGIQLSTHAAYQRYNAALAIEVITYLQEKRKIQVSEQQLRDGLLKANWIGRFEILHHDPLLILDGAHNAHGIQALVDSLQHIENICVIFSVLKDKNFEEMLTILESVTKDIVVTPFYNERSLDMKILEHRPHLRYEENYARAIHQALSDHKSVVITGSLYFISEVRAYLLNHTELLGELL